MIIEQIYTGCLSQGAYYIQSENEAAIIDPLREVNTYLKKAENNNAQIKYVLETHFHADFVSGHINLAQKSKATIVYGPNAKPKFNMYSAKDGEELKLGNCTIKVLHTPGHTMESTCYLLKNEFGKDVALFTGDTLFIGDVGRPDLAQDNDNDITQEILAGLLFQSLRNKIMPLSDDIIIYPAHGAGSACGKNLSSETSDTLGHQKKINYALRSEMTQDEFIKEVTDGLTKPPAYFPLNVLININGCDSLDTILDRSLQPLSPIEFEAIANQTQALILDTRNAEDFAKAFIPKSINIGLNGQFAPWSGALIQNVSQPILLVCDEGTETEVVTRLSRVGFDQVKGYLKNGILAWINSHKPTDTITSIDAKTFLNILEKDESIQILDVRKSTEFENGHLANSQNVPLDLINEQSILLDKKNPYYIHCQGGYRSMAFASILRARGFEHIIDIKGGYKKILENSRV